MQLSLQMLSGEQRTYGPARSLPREEARGVTRKRRASAATRIFLRTGEYENGKLGEIFIDMHKEGGGVPERS